MVSEIWIQWRPLRVHEYTFVSPCFLKVYWKAELKSFATLYDTPILLNIDMPYRKAVGTVLYNSGGSPKSCPPSFQQWAPLWISFPNCLIFLGHLTKKVFNTCRQVPRVKTKWMQQWEVCFLWLAFLKNERYIIMNKELTVLRNLKLEVCSVFGR